ncbi:MAG: hypothetical protein A3J27_02860 [Candidatus Tectomicrobia bacterium RIFCSPLOWO2_12_FULL_69_37]|nr:MAG: hypothetical protein A3I72_15570 [Candidatus Tectomicrobia bacterium RIFCSPLOWO2_02_FULL_70_19]OGL65899.1 MAG: hypothetical protein A3J27_02860 [Candidatus Tectomicrobia bacterium RIFCSPLOWO2_12_FULL_69_37]
MDWTRFHRFRPGALLPGVLAALLAWGAGPSAAAQPELAGPYEKQRVERLVAHLKRLQRSEDWLFVRKLFASDRAVQLRALASCPAPESEWPWYLSSRHMEEYRFSVDFIPVSMDADPEEETLIVIQSDPGAVSYVTFCLLDDAKRGRAPIASYSEISRSRPITFQLVNLTGEGGNELLVFTREGEGSRPSDAVRVVKLAKSRRFEMVWFARLQEQYRWPARPDPRGAGKVVERLEQLRAKVRLQFDGPVSPATLILKGERELEEVVSSPPGGGPASQKSLQTFPFEERWRWDVRLSQFVRVPQSP